MVLKDFGCGAALCNSNVQLSQEAYQWKAYSSVRLICRNPSLPVSILVGFAKDWCWGKLPIKWRKWVVVLRHTSASSYINDLVWHHLPFKQEWRNRALAKSPFWHQYSIVEKIVAKTFGPHCPGVSKLTHFISFREFCYLFFRNIKHQCGWLLPWFGQALWQTCLSDHLSKPLVQSLTSQQLLVRLLWNLVWSSEDF